RAGVRANPQARARRGRRGVGLPGRDRGAPPGPALLAGLDRRRSAAVAGVPSSPVRSGPKGPVRLRPAAVGGGPAGPSGDRSVPGGGVPTGGGGGGEGGGAGRGESARGGERGGGGGGRGAATP